MLQANRLQEIARDTIDARVTLPVKISKRIAGTCLYSGCTEGALDGSDFCVSHDSHEKGREAGKQRRRRQALADKGRCIVAGCSRKVAKRKRPNGTIQLRRCVQCSKRHRLAARAKAGVTGDRRGVPGATDERVTRDLEGDGYARTRYHGQSRRGQQPGWQLDEQDLDEAVSLLQRTKKGLELARDAEAAGVPRIQRQEIKDAALSLASQASRFVDEVLDRNRYGRNR